MRTIAIFFLMGFLHCNKWPKHQIQQLYQLSYNNSWDFIDKFLKIKPSNFDIYVAIPKTKPTTKHELNQKQKPEPKPAKNFVIPRSKVLRNDSAWLWDQIIKDKL